MTTMKRVLVTGATGCIGRQAVPALQARGWEVHAVAYPCVPDDLPGIEWHPGDLLVPGDGRTVARNAQADVLLHLAWYVAPGRWASAEENLDWVGASLDLVRAFREAGGRRLVVAGSCLEYDWAYGYCSEARTPCVPHTLYGTAKHALRLLVEGYAGKSGLSVAWGRVFFLFGPYEHPDRLVASVIRALLQGQRARTSHGMQVRDYLYSADVGDAFAALVESDLTGPVNIASGRAITLRALAGRAGELLGCPDQIDFGAIRAAPTDRPLVVADVTRLSEELQWQPTYSLDEGLSKTIEWWRRQMGLAPRTEA